MKPLNFLIKSTINFYCLQRVYNSKPFILLYLKKKIIKAGSSYGVQFHFVPLPLKRREIERDLEIETGSENAKFKHCRIYLKAGEVTSEPVSFQQRQVFINVSYNIMDNKYIAQC